MKKPDLGMTVNGCLAGLVGITGGCAYVSIEASLLIGALSGILVVFAVRFFDRIHIDDPVGATSVHLGCGVFGTLCVGLFAQEGVTSLSTANGLFFGGGFRLLGVQLLGILAIGGFTFVTSGIVWLALKKTVGIRVSREEEIQGLDIGEHGNIAYPDFAPAAEALEADDALPLPAAAAVSAKPAVGVDEAVPVVHRETKGAKITKVTILTNQTKFPQLQEALDTAGDHRYHRHQCVRLRRAEGAHHLLQGQPGVLPSATQDQDRCRGLQAAGRDAGQDRAGNPVHRPYRRREGFSL